MAATALQTLSLPLRRAVNSVDRSFLFHPSPNCRGATVRSQIAGRIEELGSGIAQERITVSCELDVLS